MNDRIVLNQKREGNYTVLDNVALRDSRLSLKATGLWAYLMHLPKDWKFYFSHLTTIKTDSKDSLRSGVAELVRHGYLAIERERQANGRFGVNTWTICERPPPTPGDAAK